MRRMLLVLGCAAACGRTVVYEPPLTKAVTDAGAVMKPCQSGQVALSHTTPTLYFVVDRSGSMAFDLFGNQGPPFGPPLMGPSRWEVLTTVMSQVLPQHDRELSMGVIFFPIDAMCAATSIAAVTPALGNAASLAAQFGNRRPGGGTPIAAAMLGVRGPAASAGAKSLVLITDGEPNCNSLLDPRTCACTQSLNGSRGCNEPELCLDDVRSVRTLSELHGDAGVVTHVVGFATTPRAAVTLDAMAVAGGAPRSGPHRFNSAETQQELAEVLDGIGEREANCTWTALTALKADDVLEVRLDSEGVPFGEGWSWLDKSRGDFVLRGAWCERSLGGTVTAQLACRE